MAHWRESIDTSADWVSPLRSSPRFVRRHRTVHHWSAEADHVWATTRSRLPDPPACDRDLPSTADSLNAEISKLWESVVAIAHSGYAIRLEGTEWTRELSADGGISRRRTGSDHYVCVAGKRGTSLRRRLRNLDLAREAIDLMTDAIEATESPTTGSIRLPERAAVSLTGDLAGVLVHELVGHALEEGDLAVGKQVLPSGVAVSAVSRTRDLDDTGVPSADLTVVEDGRVHAAAAPGHSWRALHGLVPEPRLTDLRVVNHGPVTSAAAAQTVRPTVLRGAWYFNGNTVLDVLAGTADLDGVTVTMSPLRVVVTTDELAQAKFDNSVGQSSPLGGVCVKNGEALTSHVECPALFLPAATVWST